MQIMDLKRFCSRRFNYEECFKFFFFQFWIILLFICSGRISYQPRSVHKNLLFWRSSLISDAFWRRWSRSRSRKWDRKLARFVRIRMFVTKWSGTWAWYRRWDRNQVFSTKIGKRKIFRRPFFNMLLENPKRPLKCSRLSEPNYKPQG